MSKQVKLKPCPFCGSKTVKIIGLAMKAVYCVECSAEGPGALSNETVIAKWNKRTPEGGAR